MNGEQTKKEKAVSDLMCNIALADITKVSVEEFVKQITLIEISYFAAIKRSEFLSLKWNGRDKKIYAPNIVESTRWFNQLNFWVQKEILKYQAVNKRTEMLAFFIKLAKRLVEINNLYSAMSIVSALQVECIYRLRHTWSGLGNRERTTYRKLEELFGQQDNCRLLREHTASMRLPGIPYLGLYLSDLTYTNVAHPRINGQPTTVWVTKLNTIVDAIAHFQQSRFIFPCDDTIRAYLLAQSYIEELQKFLESANFKMSLQLEPPLLTDFPVSLSPNNTYVGDGLVDSPTSGKLISPLDFRRGNSATLTTSRPALGSNVPSPSTKLPPLPGYGGYNSDQEGCSGKHVTKKTPISRRPGETNEIAETEGGKEFSTTPLKCLAPTLIPSLGCSAQGLVANRALFMSTQSAVSLGKNFSDSSRINQISSTSCNPALKEKAASNSDDKCDRAVQVSTPPDSSIINNASATACLLCGHRCDSIIDDTSTVIASLASEDASQNMTKNKLLPALSPELRTHVNHNICAALIAILTTPGSPAKKEMPVDNNMTITHSSSVGHFSVSTPPPASTLHHPWPPVVLPLTALRAACILLEGPVKRKTVGRLIPPGLETPVSIGRDEFTRGTDSGLSSSTTSQHRGGNSGFGLSWKTYWACLISVDCWSEACILYFETTSSICRNASRREDFSTSFCQIQSFQKSAAKDETSTLPYIGLARHRNGGIDESSFLLTHPGLQKTYRLRPVISKVPSSNSTPQKKHSLIGCVPMDIPTSSTPFDTESPQRKNSRRFFRKVAVDSIEDSPTRTTRGSSAPILASTRSVKDASSSFLLTLPTVEDWLQAIQLTLDSMNDAL